MGRYMRGRGFMQRAPLDHANTTSCGPVSAYPTAVPKPLCTSSRVKSALRVDTSPSSHEGYENLFKRVDLNASDSIASRLPRYSCNMRNAARRWPNMNNGHVGSVCRSKFGKTLTHLGLPTCRHYDFCNSYVKVFLVRSCSRGA